MYVSSLIQCLPLILSPYRLCNYLAPSNCLFTFFPHGRFAPSTPRVSRVGGHWRGVTIEGRTGDLFVLHWLRSFSDGGLFLLLSPLRILLLVFAAAFSGFDALFFASREIAEPARSFRLGTRHRRGHIFTQSAPVSLSYYVELVLLRAARWLRRPSGCSYKRASPVALPAAIHGFWLTFLLVLFP